MEKDVILLDIDRNVQLKNLLKILPELPIVCFRRRSKNQKVDAWVDISDKARMVYITLADPTKLTKTEEISMCHEIGHLLDPKLAEYKQHTVMVNNLVGMVGLRTFKNKKIQKNILEFERRAWRLAGRAFKKQAKTKFFVDMMRKTMLGNKQDLEEMAALVG